MAEQQPDEELYEALQRRGVPAGSARRLVVGRSRPGGLAALEAADLILRARRPQLVRALTAAGMDVERAERLTQQGVADPEVFPQLLSALAAEAGHG